MRLVPILPAIVLVVASGCGDGGPIVMPFTRETGIQELPKDPPSMGTTLPSAEVADGGPPLSEP